MTVTEAAGAGGLVVGSSGHQSPARRRPKPWAWLPYALVVPILAFEGVFVIYPIIKGIITSFTSQKLGQAKTFTTENYSQMFSDPIFWEVVRTTLEFTASVLVLVLLVGLGIALLLNWSFRGRTLVRGRSRDAVGHAGRPHRADVPADDGSELRRLQQDHQLVRDRQARRLVDRPARRLPVGRGDHACGRASRSTR